MGIIIEQYRACIGAHNCTTEFQLVINKASRCATALIKASCCATAIIIKASRCATAIITKASRCATAIIKASHCATAIIIIKRFSQVIASFTQISCYIVHVALLLRMSNDVEPWTHSI